MPLGGGWSQLDVLGALEFFLGLDQVKGFEKRRQDIKGDIERLCRGSNPGTNDSSMAWASRCTELIRFQLLGERLGLAITGFDRESPHRKGLKNCDARVLLDGREVFVEVKSKGAEMNQVNLPPALQDCLLRLKDEIPYGISVELQGCRYKCIDCDALRAEVMAHLDLWNAEDVPPARGFQGSVILRFHPERPLEGVHFSGDGAIDSQGEYNVKPWLFGTAKGPAAVEKAIEKGADYLLARVSCWDPWEEVVRQCFGQVDWRTAKTCFVSSDEWEALRGVVLYSGCDEFCIVNNSSCAETAWFEF